VSPKQVSSAQQLAEMFATYKAALDRLEAGIGADFDQAVALIADNPGHLIVCGMGKSGLVGRKIAATLSSTGTPALFLHPAEAIHGDLGMVRKADNVLLISNSGETEEIVRLLPALQRLEARLIALVGNPASTMARQAELVLDISVDKEACPLNLAPTTSTLTTLVMGDALAIALMRARGFQPEDFAATHPGGKLGQRLLTRVRDRAFTDNLPFVDADQPMSEVIVRMTEGRLGLALVGTADKLEGIITDGDLRRLMVEGHDLAATRAGAVMNTKPLTIEADVMMAEAEEKMLEARVQCLVVLDKTGQFCGIVQIF
jgi:arabinose-5-phosphate isomerase